MLSIFNYDGKEIAFAQDGLVIGNVSIPKGYVNATEMCKANGKKMKHYNENKSTKAYHAAFSASAGIPTNQLIIETGVENVPNELRGTWIHPDLALHLAQWISAEFYVWCNMKLKELMQTKPMSQLELAQYSINLLVEQERRLKQLELENKLNTQRLHEVEDLVNQHDSELDRVFNPYGHYYSVLGYHKLQGGSALSIKQASSIGKQCTKYCKDNDIPIEKINDPRFGQINSYPEQVIALFI
jgi:hypothetical protein